MAIAFLEPDNLEDALLNWAAWHSPTYNADDPLNAVSLNCAIAVDALFDTLHWKEKDAIRYNYLRGISASNGRFPRGLTYNGAALHTAKQAIEQGLRDRKLISN